MNTQLVLTSTGPVTGSAVGWPTTPGSGAEIVARLLVPTDEQKGLGRMVLAPYQPFCAGCGTPNPLPPALGRIPESWRGIGGHVVMGGTGGTGATSTHPVRALEGRGWHFAGLGPWECVVLCPKCLWPMDDMSEAEQAALFEPYSGWARSVPWGPVQPALNVGAA